MKESYREDLANHLGLEPYAADGDIRGVASARGNVGQLLSSEILTFVCRSYPVREKATSPLPLCGEAVANAAESQTLGMRQTFQAREPGDPIGFRTATVACHGRAERSENVTDGNAEMNADRKSDEFIVPATSANNDAAEASAESIEERGSTKREHRAGTHSVPDTEPE